MVSIESLREQTVDVSYSKDSLDAPVEYSATDTMIYDFTNELVHLYGDASVNYQTISLKADYIVLNWATNTVTAEGTRDSLGRLQKIPEFSDGDQAFKANKMRYNFTTQKGVIYDATSQYNDMYIHGTKAKFSGKGVDSTEYEQCIYSQDALFTTCNHPNPHFGIRSKKQKVIPNKIAVVGPSNLEIGNVPTPLWLPFGFFPLAQGNRSGLIFPQDYEYSDQWGFGLKGVGYYFAINDKVNLTILTDFYLKRSWGITLSSQYKRRYKYNGQLTLGYSDRRQEETGTTIIGSQKSYSITWNHNQDAKAHPTRKLNGTVNIQTNDYQSLNNNDYRNVTQNQLTSNITFSKTFPGRPYTFSASMNHSQNTTTGAMDISFPQLNFNMQRIYPFKRKERIGKEKWYEKFSLQYKGEAKNRFLTTDSLLFTQQTLDEAQYGVRHTLNSGASFRLLKYFNVSPNANYKEIWYFNTIQKELDPTLQLRFDTTYNDIDGSFVIDTTVTDYGTLNEITEFGLKPLRLYDASVTINTQLFGTLLFKRGPIRGIRHVMKPSISFAYEPDYTNEDLGYFDYVQADTRDTFLTRYDIYENGIYNRPSTAGKRMAITYGLNNIFEAKVFSKRDSTDRKIKLFDNIRINGDYNFAKDSLQFSPVRMAGTARFFNGITNLNLSANFDPYVERDGVQLNTLLWDTDKKLLRFTDANATISTNMSIAQIKKIFNKDNKKPGNKKEEQATNNQNSGPQLADFFQTFRLTHHLTFSWRKNSQEDTVLIATNNLRLNGSIPISEHWNVRLGSIGYDFKTQRITYPDLGIYRDLHCWEMGLDWQPLRGTYTFFIRVKPSSLDFLKLPYQKNNADALSGF